MHKSLSGKETTSYNRNQLIVDFQSFLEFLSIKEPSVELSAADDLSSVIRTLDPAKVFFFVAIRLSSDLHNNQHRIQCLLGQPR